MFSVALIVDGYTDKVHCNDPESNGIKNPAASGGVFSEEFSPPNAASGGEFDPKRLNTMDQTRSQQYLKALGVTVWRLRHAPAPAPFKPIALPEPELPPATPDAVQFTEPESPPPIEQPIPTAWDWPTLQAKVADCHACGLRAGCTQTVLGTGNRQASLMLIGEAPGQDEDRQGEPFVGRAGQLLNQMLIAIQLTREQVYIGNIIKCRPPGNRDPQPEEIACCRAYIERQIELVAPKVVLCLGRIAAQTLLSSGDPVGRLRGRWYAYGEQQIPLRVTYHPSYYLRSPTQKALGWQDLQQVMRQLRT